MNELPSFQSWPKILESIRTPLSLMGLIVLVMAVILIIVLPKVEGLQLQVLIIIGSFIVLFAVIVAMTLHTFSKGNPYPEEILSIWSKEDLPISELEKQCWLGKWNCRWTYRSIKGELLPYVDDVVNIESIDPDTGKLNGTAISAYGSGETYRIVGRISNKRIAHIFYSSPPPRTGLSGMAILSRPPVGDLSGWWLGAGRQGGDIGGGVTMSKAQVGDNFELKVYPVTAIP